MILSPDPKNMKSTKNRLLSLSVLWLLLQYGTTIAQPQYNSLGIWSETAANTWYSSQPWLVGMNYTPAYAINQLEMWQAETFDLQAIEKELQWAEKLGFNTARVFLHDLLWEQDRESFLKRIDAFLNVADKHGIKVMLVLFDSVWDPKPQLGTQRMPKKGVHNSGWVQSPGLAALMDTVNSYPRLEHYVKGIVGRFAHDSRVLVWDLVNEADNRNRSSYVAQEPDNKMEYGLSLLKASFRWAREMLPSQPITSGIWLGDWSSEERMTKMDLFLVQNSDVISFHSYHGPEEYEQRVTYLQRYNRPLLCTEYMARPRNSTFEYILPIAKKHKVASYNWGFVNGKTNTIYPWDSWEKPYEQEPDPWFHDIFKANGEPYSKKEVQFIEQIIQSGK